MISASADACLETYRHCTASRQARVVQVIADNATAPLSELAEKAGVSRTTVNKVQKQLGQSIDPNNAVQSPLPLPAAPDATIAPDVETPAPTCRLHTIPTSETPNVKRAIEALAALSPKERVLIQFWIDQAWYGYNPLSEQRPRPSGKLERPRQIARRSPEHGA